MLARCSIALLFGQLACCDCGGRSPLWVADAGPRSDGGGDADPGDGGAEEAPDCPPRPCDEDADHDGQAAWPCGDDCDDADPEIYAGAIDPVGDGIDTSCDGIDGLDEDRDGYLAVASGGDDCDDLDATVYPGANDNEGWKVEGVIGEIGFGAESLAIALGPRGEVHVADAGTVDVQACGDGKFWVAQPAHHVRIAGGRWFVEQVDDWCGDPRAPAATAGVTVGQHGLVHVGTFAENRDVRGFTEMATGWDEAALGPHDDGTSVLSLVLDPCERPHVAFDQDGPVRHAVLEAGSWNEDAEGVPTSPSARLPSITFDRRGTLHLAFVANGLLGYLSFRDGRWSSEQLVASVGAVSQVSLAVGPDDELRAALDGADGIRLAVLHRAEWSVETVDPTDHGLQHGPALAVDASGASHLLYEQWRSSEGIVRYATDASGAWVLRTLAADAGNVAAVVEPGGGLHVVYGVRQGAEYGILREGLDGVDQNCDGVDGVDADHDGHASVATGGDDPDDADASR